jgi:hypothetical protein
MINKKLGMIALLASFAGSTVWAGNLDSYAVGDVLLGFRNGGTYDLVVDVGPASTFINATNNQVITLNSTYFTTAQLNSAFSSSWAANGVYWTAFSWYDSTVSPNWTLFMSNPRTILNVQAPAWADQSAAVQKNTALEAESVPLGASFNTNFNVLNTSTAVIEQNNSSGNPNYPQGQSYYDSINGEAGGNWDNNFEGNPENNTPGGFTTAISDFYQLTPGGGNSTWLGYFELSASGAMVYVAYPSSVPVIKSISRAGNTSTINYTTGVYGTYTLHGTNTLTSGVAPANWPVINTLSTGDTLTHTYMDTDPSPNKFYIITTQ